MNAFMIIRIVLVTAMFAILCAMQILRFRNTKGGPGFDERQKLIQGRAYRDAFYTVMAVLVIYAVLSVLNKTGILPIWFVAGTIIVLGMGVYLTECTLLDAGTRPKEDVHLTLGGWGGFLLLNILSNVGGMVNENTAGWQWIFFSLLLIEISALCLVLFIVNFIKNLKNNRRQ